MQICIDEEGRYSFLSAVLTEDSRYVRIRVEQESSKSTVFLEEPVDRALFAAALREEFIRFFTTEFIQTEWDDDSDKEYEFSPLFANYPFAVRSIEENEEDDDEWESYSLAKELVLNHPWITK